MRKLKSERGLLVIGSAMAIALVMAAVAGFQQYAAAQKVKEVAARVDDFEGFYGSDTAMHSLYFRVEAEQASPTGFFNTYGGSTTNASFEGKWNAAEMGGSAFTYAPASYLPGTPAGGQYTLALDSAPARMRRMAVGSMKWIVPPKDPADPNRIAPGMQRVCGTYELPSGTYQRCITGVFDNSPMVTLTANGVQPTLSITVPQDPNAPTLPCVVPSVTIAWNASNATGCTITAYSDPGIVPGPGTPYTPTVSIPPAVWTGLTGSQVVTNLTASQRFRATCVNGANTTVRDVVITVVGVNAWATSPHIIFSSRLRWTGNLGGLAGADAKCQASAVAAGLRPWATWRAVLSDSFTNANARIAITGVVRNTCFCGAGVVANNAAQFWTSGSWVSPVGCNEYGYDNTVGHGPPGKTPLYAAQCNSHGTGGKHTWTASNLDGTRKPWDTCWSWTVSSPATVNAAGDANDPGPGDRFCDGGECNHRCDTPLMLYCISQ